MDSIRTRGLALTTTFLAALGMLLVIGGGSALAAHVGCGDTIVQDTTLHSDLVNCPGDGVLIGADNVTLDLHGHTIDGDVASTSSLGVANGKCTSLGCAQGYDGVTIENGTIKEFGTGVAVFYGASGTSLRGLTVLANDDVAIRLAGSVDNRVEQNLLSGNASGGLFLGSSDRNLIDGNVITRNRSDGIGSAGSNENVITNNSVSRTVAGGGIRLDDASNTSRVERNVVTDNEFGGIFAGGDHNVISRNKSARNQAGVSLGYGADNRIELNSVSRNVDGIFVGADPVSTLVRGNIASGNSDDGIDIESAATTVTANTANRNGDLGIEAVPGVIDGGGNKAFGNGNPLQCLNVACN